MVVLCMGLEHINIKIFGRVQGVFFRDSARAKAAELGIAGFAKNESDGTVYIEAEGERNALEQFLSWCRRGPESSLVEKAEYSPGEFRGFSDFVI